MSRRSKKKQRSQKLLPPPEQLLLDFLEADWQPGRVLCFQSNLQPLTTELLQRPGLEAQLDCFSFDKAVSTQIAQQCQQLSDAETRTARFQDLCDSEFPEADYDAVLLPLSQQFSDEYVRDLTLSAVRSLRTGGTLTIASPRSKDYEYHKFLQSLFAKVTRVVSDAGIVYQGKKQQDAPAKKTFQDETAIREGDRLLYAYTVPGVFSHRRPNQSARTLINLMELSEEANILNFDCGSGIVAFAAAVRCPAASVHAVDTNARAVSCTEQGIAKNELTNVRAELITGEADLSSEAYDYLLTNKSYFTSEEQGEEFLQLCLRALKPGGLLQFSTKQYQWYANRLLDLFTDVAIDGAVHHFMLSARKPE